MTIPLLLAVVATVSGFQASLDRMRIAQDIPGVSAVIMQGDDHLFAGGSGLANIETGREMTADTALYAGSLSKILTAMLVLRLVDEGVVSLDEPIAGILHPETGDITVMQLLTHTSGLEREGDFGYWFSAEFPDESALRSYLDRSEPLAAPGESVRYSNIGYAVLGLIVQNAIDTSYTDALNTKLLQPLGMSASGAPGPAAGIAAGYTPVGRIIPSADRPFAGVGKSIAGRHVREYHDAGAMTPAFGAYTTARELGRLAQYLLDYGNTTIISDEMRSLMLSEQVDGRGVGLRITWLNGRRVARHDGWFAAHKSHLLLDLETGISVAVLANSDNASPDEIAKELLAEALAQKNPVAENSDRVSF